MRQAADARAAAEPIAGRAVRAAADHFELKTKDELLDVIWDDRRELSELREEIAELRRTQAWLEGTMAEARREKEAATAGASPRRRAEGAAGDHFELMTKDELLDVIWDDRQELEELRAEVARARQRVEAEGTVWLEESDAVCFVECSIECSIECCIGSSILAGRG